MTVLGLKSKGAERIQSVFDDEQEGALINVEGDEKTGKNHFAFTAPKPLLCISGDRDARPVARKFKGVHVARFKYDLPIVTGLPEQKASQRVADVVRPYWKEAEALYYEAVKSTKVRSIVIDTGTWAWDTIRLAKFGRLLKVPPLLYTQVNALFERMVLCAQGSGKHVVWIHRTDDEWINVKEQGKMVGHKTGRRIRSSFKNIGFDVEANIRMERDGSSFRATVIDNGFDPTLNGAIFKRRQCTYPRVMSMLTGTEVSRWQ